MDERDALVPAMFIAAVRRNKMSVALYMITTYPAILLRASDDIVSPLLYRFEKDKFVQMEVFMKIIKLLQPEFDSENA